MYDHYFSNFGRPPVPDDLCKDSAPKHPWSPWSTNRDHFSNLLFPLPKEAPYEIWAKLAKRLQRRSCLKFWTFFPYKCIRKQTWPYRKKVKSQCTTIILAILVSLPFPMICATRGPWATTCSPEWHNHCRYASLLQYKCIWPIQMHGEANFNIEPSF